MVLLERLNSVCTDIKEQCPTVNMGGCELETLLGAIESRLYSSRDDEHYHQCRHCKTIWQHRASDFKTQAEHTAGHTCQDCGLQQYTKCDATGKPL